MKNKISVLAALLIFVLLGSVVLAQAPIQTQTNEYRITVNNMSETMEQIMFAEPEPGNMYLVLDMTVENIGTKSVKYGPLNFLLKDENGYEYSAYLGGPHPYLKSGELGAGDMARGNVAFQVPQAASNLRMTFRPNLFSTANNVTLNLSGSPASPPAVSEPQIPDDPRLQAIITAWPFLTEETKDQLVSVIEESMP